MDQNYFFGGLIIDSSIGKWSLTKKTKNVIYVIAILIILLIKKIVHFCD